MSFNTALSGIKASADFLSTTGNNIANSDTTGFKKSRVEFGDLYNTNVIGAGSNNTIGSGVGVDNIAQEFSSGNIAYTDNNLDLAVDGTGFFVLDAGGTQTYTRAGDFKLDENGFLVTNDGANVQGYNAVDGLIGGSLEDLIVPTDRIPPKASNELQIDLSLDSQNEAMPPYISTSFDPTDPETYTFTQTTNDGAVPPNAVTLYYAKAEAPNTYEVYATVNGEETDGTGTPYLAETYVTFDDAEGSVTEAATGTAVPFQPIYVGNTEPQVGDLDATVAHTITAAGISFGDGTAPDIVSPGSNARPPFDPADPKTFTYNNTNTVYDALGERHTIGYYFIKHGEDNTYEIKVTVDGEVNKPLPVPQFDAAGNPIYNTPGDPTSGQVTAIEPFLAEDTVIRFDQQGNYAGTYVGYPPYATASPTELVVTQWDPTNPAAELTIDMSNSTQYSSNRPNSGGGSDRFVQDGYAAGELQGVSFDEDGKLIASYTNQQTNVLGQIALATFDNVDGLTPAGSTAWVASSSSGAANVGKANTGTFGSIQGGALEESNVDITEELVALIEAQRNYQANSKTLETENTVTQTIINLR